MEKKMKFRGHETFFIRKGWLYKGLKNVKSSPNVFISKEKNPMDVLGIGANMVKSLRYWMKATGLAVESNKKGEKSNQSLTKFAEIIYQNDPYLEEIGTLCFIHYKLVTNEEQATAWYYLFNQFCMKEFQKEDFITALKNYANVNNSFPADGSLEDDFNCLINTYVERKKINPSRINPESNIESPFEELGLLSITNSNNKDRIFKKVCPSENILSPFVVIAGIIEQNPTKKEIKIRDLLEKEKSIGKAFNLDIVALSRELEKLVKMGFIEVIRTAGLDVVRIKTDKDFNAFVGAYYESMAK